MFTQLQKPGLGYHVVQKKVWGLSAHLYKYYTDDIALLAPSLQCLKQIIYICEKYASSHSITFNPNKSKLLCYHADLTSNAPQVYLNGEKIPVVDSDKHLGKFLSTNIADKNITENVCDLYKRSHWIISDFRVCDSSTLDSLHKTYCMHMYGCSYGT